MPLERKPDGKYKSDKFAGNRTERVVFIPWANPDAQEWVDKTNQWNVAKGNIFEIIVYDPNVAHHATLARIGGDPQAVIYIRGHGNPGEEYIQVKILGTENAKKLPIVEACQRLIGMGLPTGYAGAIKFYSCHSGTKLIPKALKQAKDNVASHNKTLKQGLAENMISQQQFDDFKRVAPHNQSMASQGAEYMRSRGYKKCKYYGYLGPLGSTYEQDDSAAWHKVVELDGLYNRPKALNGLIQVRPSIARVRV